MHPDEAVAGARDVLASIGDNGPECPPDCGRLRAARNRSHSTVEQPKKWRAAYRAHTVGSDGHFVGFEPLTWQLHRGDPPLARPPSSGPTALLGHGDAATALTAEPEHRVSPTGKREAQLGPNPARRANYCKSEMCSECGNSRLVRNGTCMKCNTCGCGHGQCFSLHVVVVIRPSRPSRVFSCPFSRH